MGGYDVGPAQSRHLANVGTESDMTDSSTGYRGSIRWKPEEDSQLMKLITNGKSTVFIAGAPKRSTQSVRNRIRTLKVIGK
jgi:hypothetical protein